ncbi:MAG: TauD/TfdA family dioxygenase [Myxococcales bacterium]|nr:TauD/TfdA family dioxygenase [Myxococcales bacterium]
MPELRPWLSSFGATVTPASGEAPELAALVDAAQLRGWLSTYGALLLSGFRGDTIAFEGFTARFAAEFVAHGAGVRRRLGGDGYTQTVTEGNAALVLHRELHFCPFSPDVLWFRCEQRPREGGETLLADGRAFFERLGAPARRALERRRVRYWNLWAPTSWPAYFPALDEAAVRERMPALGMRGSFTADGSLEFHYCAAALTRAPDGATAFANSIDIHFQYLERVQAFQRPSDHATRHRIAFEDGEPIPRALHHEIHAIGEALARPLPWAPGDVLMVDNTWVLHGRREFHVHDPRALQVRM